MKDTREVAVSLLANRRRRTIAGNAVVKATTLLLDTASYKTGLISQHAFLNRVRRPMNDKDLKREAHISHRRMRFDIRSVRKNCAQGP